MYHYPKKQDKYHIKLENFDSLNSNQITLIKTLSPYLRDIKNLSDLLKQLTNGDINVQNGLNILGGLTVGGNTTLNNSTNTNNLNVKQNEHISGSLIVDNDINISGNSNVSKNLNISGNITAANSRINQNSTVNGTASYNEFDMTLSANDKLTDLFNIQSGIVNLCKDESNNETCNWKTTTDNIIFNRPFKKIPQIVLSLSSIRGDTRGSTGIYLQANELLTNLTTNGFTIDWSLRKAPNWSGGKSYSISWIAFPAFT
jgi:choice-of-anchor A domain-containing protein